MGLAMRYVNQSARGVTTHDNWMNGEMWIKKILKVKRESLVWFGAASIFFKRKCFTSRKNAARWALTLGNPHELTRRHGILEIESPRI